ncbi:MAG TPA: hypothetical protein VF824_10270 [Thermoanaerobaculia bacterium]|jgi:hypothetical protein
MRTLAATILLLGTVSAFAHAGHQHKILGTVKSLQENRLVVTAREGSDVAVTLTPSTSFERGTRADVTAGTRISVEVDNDNRALRVKVGTKEQ